MFDKSVSFPVDGDYHNLQSMIKAININCDNIYFDRIPLSFEYNHNMNQWELFTTKEYQKALEYCLKDMYWG